MRSPMRNFALSLLAATALTLPAYAETHSLPETASGSYVLDKSHANVLFFVNHLGFSDYIGRFNAFDAKLQLDAKDPSKSSVEVTITPASADTNNQKMEDKLRGKDYFNVAEHPEIKFVSREIKVTGKDTGTITGDLTMLGVTKPVTLNASFVGAGENKYAGAYVVGFRATGTVKRSEFGLNTLLPYVGDDVKVHVEAEFLKQP